MNNLELMPTFLDYLKAKSADDTGHMQTLAEHTWHVLERLADQYRLRPTLAAEIGDERFWQRMFYGCFLHDFGKAAAEFQARLYENAPVNQWSTGQHRHEVLSLAFVDWLFPEGHPDRLPVIAIIIAHHKDVDLIFDKYGVIWRTPEETQRVNWLMTQIDAPVQAHLCRWLVEFAEPWRAALGLPNFPDPPVVTEGAFSANAILLALDNFSDYLLRYEEIGDSFGIAVDDVLYRGLILTADHAASAGAPSFPSLRLDRAIALRPLGTKTPRQHQTQAGEVIGSALMIAPTGSGKTEAALLWSAAQIAVRPRARLFYTLPYQASMNAMYERLLTRFYDYSPEAIKAGNCNEVTIQHSRALLKFYQDRMDLDEQSPKQARKLAKWMRNLGQLNYHPIRVFSPYQMLKAAYGLKGYETLLLDYTNALFIFDEIHAYEPQRLALIITLIEWLRTRFNATFFVMTATLPPPVQERLLAALALPAVAIVQASPAEFQRSQRHVVQIHDGRLGAQIVESVRQGWDAGEAILICLNRIADAQQVYQQIQTALALKPDDEIVLLHGRFNGIDRKRKEAILLDRAGVQRRVAGRPFVAVATQAVEVSLDVDFDTIYTDPAPLEALLQRFGRVNRGRAEQVLCPVHLFRVPNSSKQKPYLPYDEAMVVRSLAILERYCGDGRPIDESLVTTMLGEIYTGEIRAAWDSVYAKSAQDFRTAILGSLKPFYSAEKDIQDRFYAMFDGYEVVPCDCVNDYQDALEREGYLAASGYLVNISAQQYGEFYGYGLIYAARAEEGAYADHINVAYSSEWGLDIDGAREAWKAQRTKEEE